MKKLNLKQRVNLLSNKVDNTKVTEDNIMFIMKHFNQSLESVLDMPLYTFNKFVAFLNEKKKPKNLAGKTIGGLHGFSG